MTDWESAQESEMAWWGDCLNTYAEETMQLAAAQAMKLDVDPVRAVVKATGNIVDIGGGPTSLLLKTEGITGTVVDPGAFPPWVLDRYEAAGIEYVCEKGEDYLRQPHADIDEVWIYNTLQHVEDPEAIVRGAIRAAPVVRLFEWIGFPTNECHIHVLRASHIIKWARKAGAKVSGGTKKIEWAGETNASYGGVFRRPRMTVADSV